MAASLEGNKLFAAILTAGIIGAGSGVFATILYHPKELDEPVYAVAVPEPTAEGGAAVAESQPIDQLMLTASVESGQAAFKKCVSCHSVEKGGANKVGPNLWEIVNRDIGGHPGFAYSEALTGKEGTWTYEHLNEFLKNPKGWAPGTKMAFAGIGKDAERADLIAYLRSLADQPVPLPGG